MKIVKILMQVLSGLLLNKKSMKVALNCIPQTEQRFIKVTEVNLIFYGNILLIHSPHDPRVV